MLVRSPLFIIAILIFLAGFLALETGVSVAIFEIVAGVLTSNLLCIPSEPWLDFLANFGLIGLLFFAGFELNRDALRAYWRESLSTGIASGVTPTLLVFFLLWALGYPPLTCLVFAIAFSATSLDLLYTILHERGILRSQHGQVMLTAAMIDDIYTMALLLIFFERTNLPVIAILAALTALLFFSPRFASRLLARYRGNIIEFEMRFILLFLLTLGAFSITFGAHLAIFAYPLGFIFSEFIRYHEALEEKLRGIVFSFFAPIFFFKVGLMIDLRCFPPLSLLIPAILLAFFSKFLGVWALLRRHLPRIATFGGIAFNLRSSCALAVAYFALAFNMVTTAEYSAIVLTVLILTLSSALALRAIPREQNA